MNPFMKTIFLAGTTILLTVFLIHYPSEALSASLRGLTMWAEVVFPSLLPFFITAELLLAFGVVKFLGVLFEPIMRPLFNVPGAGSFGWMMGMASGYPTGAKISARLREEKQLSRIEAERLVSFTNNSSPLFIFGAISVGFFHDARLGILLAVCHYGSNALVGFIMRFHGIKSESKTDQYKAQKMKFKLPSLMKALRSMHQTRMKDARPLGEVLGDAVLQSIKTLVMVGGFIILFSVMIRLLHLVHVSVMFSNIFKFIFIAIGIPPELALPFFSGLFEITLGATLIAQTDVNSLLHQAVIVSFILGFNGFSIQAQVASILAKTDIRFAPYFIARILHGILASCLTFLLYKPLYLNQAAYGKSDIPVFGQTANNIFEYLFHIIKMTGPFLTCFFLFIALLLIAGKMKRDGSS